ncbi:GntR family transcriptional regulator [Phenylobacterium sp.]|uniref:GntR family transcriptional regulator n=1 Tax=Phenylobacterium sp. TaxID=1871053 RepID=UPI002F3EE14C
MTGKRSPAEGIIPSKLQRKVALQISEYIRDNGLQPGDHLSELGLAEALSVSRTPVRRALEYLTELNVVTPNGPRRGFEVVGNLSAATELAEDTAQSDEEEALYMQMAADYVAWKLPEQLSEADMMRQYGVHRGLLRRTLQRMVRDQVVERNLGHGWHFKPLLRSIESHDKSYRFRMLVEPAGLLEPSFALDRSWAEQSRRNHEVVLRTPVDELSMVAFFDVNAEFHAGLAACSCNEFFFQAVRQQNQLRRFLCYSPDVIDRVADSCNEHLRILDAVEAGDLEWASTLMRRHLEIAFRIKPAPVRVDDSIRSRSREK